MPEDLDQAKDHFRAGRWVQCQEVCRQMLSRRSDDPEAMHLMGLVAYQMTHLDEAQRWLAQAIAVNPLAANYHSNLGVVLTMAGQNEEAVAAYQRALELQPTMAESYNNLAIALAATDRFDESILACRQAISLRPGYLDAYNNLGKIMMGLARLDEAIDCFRRALALDVHDASLHSNLIMAMLYHPGCDAVSIAQEQDRWNQQQVRPLKPFIRPHTNTPQAHRRLRIGYVSADFRYHTCAYYLNPLLAHHDHEQFEITCYAYVPSPDPMTEYLQPYADRWRSIVGLSPQQAADEIRADGIDILVDLGLHTLDQRLLIFAHQPAPVQASWLGYPGSSGAETIQYRLSDRFLDPPGSQQQPGEQVIYLPDCFWCYDPLTPDVPTNDLPALQAGHVTFCCLSNFVKVNDQVLELWAMIMRQVSGSRLALLCPPGAHRQAVVDKLGVEPDRVEFVQRRPRRPYLDMFHRIDIHLDTFPFNSPTTGLDGMWMGVPLVSLVGHRVVGRGGLSILSNLGHSELVAADAQQYVKIAVELAGDLGRLSELRRTLRPRMLISPLMDAKRFAANMESAYRQMWRNWCASRTMEAGV